MKKLKRITCLMLVLVFAMSMVACGSKGSSKKLEELSVDDLGTKVMEAGKNEVKGLTAEAKMKMNISASMDGESMDLVSLNADIDVKFDKASMLAKSAVDMTMSMLGQEQKESAESYMKYGEGTVTTYSFDGEEWDVTTQESEDSTDILASLDEIQNLDISEIKEYFSSMESKTSGGNYVIEASATIAELLELAGEYGEEALGDMGIDADTMPDLTINFEAQFDGETYLPKSVKVSVDGDKIDYEGMELEVKACEFEMEFTSYDAVSIEIPQEALDAE